MKNILKFL